MDKNLNPIRVLMVTSEWPRPGVNVTSHFIKRQADFLVAAGVDVTVFPFRGRKNPFNYLRNWVRLQTKLRREKYDLVHAQFGQSGLLALPRRLPLVVTFRGSDLYGTVSDKTRRHLKVSGVQKYLSRLVAIHSDEVIVVAEHMKTQLHSSIISHVIPSGLDLHLFRPTERRAARIRLGLPEDERLVLFVGRTNHGRKRGYLAEQAMEILNKSLPARLVVAWAIPHTDVPLYMSACDVLVFTSMQEGSPNVVKEALACNLPIVSVPVGDVGSRLEGVESCELCANDDPETIAAALNRILLKGGRTNGRETVLGLDENITAQKVIAIYQSVLTSSQASAS